MVVKKALVLCMRWAGVGAATTSPPPRHGRARPDLAPGHTNGSIIGMTAARKVKISVSLDAALVDAVDRRAAREGTTRSAVMEQWLKRASGQAALARLEEETAAYYDALGPMEKQDDLSWAKALPAPLGSW